MTRQGQRIILMEASNSSSAIAALYRYRKALDTKFSLAYLARKSSISSTGYLSDVIKGKRTLHLKYKLTIGPALGLDQNETEYLATLITIEHAKGDDKGALQKDLDRLKKLLQIDLLQVHFGRINLLFSVLLMSSFSIFKGKPTLADLVDFFGKANSPMMREHLAHLVQQNIVSIENENYVLKVPHLLFAKSDNDQNIVTFLREALLFAASKVEQQFSDFENSNFTTTVIGVNKKKYQASLKKIKVDLLKMQMQLENTEDADMLVYFNSQVFPVENSDIKNFMNQPSNRP